MSDGSAWSDPDIIVQLGAVAAAVGAAAVIAWQAVLTRRSLREAESSRELTEESLELARAEQERTTVLAIEAVKSRIAASSPSIDVAIERIDDARYGPSTISNGDPQPWPEDHVFRIDEAANRVVIVRSYVTVTNTGSRAVRVVLHGVLRPFDSLLGWREGPEDILLQPSEVFSGAWDLSRTVQQWIDSYTERVSGKPGLEAELSAYVDDGNDTGAMYAFTVVIGGTAVEPERSGLTESWKLTGAYTNGSASGIGWGRKPTAPRYWLSKLREVPLPEAPSIPIPDSWKTA